MPSIPNIDINPPKYGTNFAAELYKMITDVPKMYQEGAEGAFKRGQYAHTEALQKPFLDENGQPVTDPRRLMEMYAQRAPEKIPETAGWLFRTSDIPEPSRPSPYGAPEPAAFEKRPEPPPIDNRGAETFGQSGDNLRGAAARQQPAESTVSGMTAGAFDPEEAAVLVPRYARALGVEPNAPLTPGQQDSLNHYLAQTRNAVLAGGKIVPDATRPQPQASTIGQQGPAPAAAPGSGPAMAINRPGAAPTAPASALAMVPGGMDPRLYAQRLQQAGDRAYEIAKAKAFRGIPAGPDEAQGKAYHETAAAVLKELAESTRPTTGMREARDVAVQQAKAATKLGEDVATAKGKRIGEIIEAGGLPNRETVNTLNIMEDAMRHGGRNISTGPGAEQWLKVKQAANNMWPGLFQGVPEAETVVKLNAQLASQAAKAMTARPSQLEFKAFMANNPGLANSREGTFALINILRQAKEQELALSRKAMNAANYDNWTDVEDKFFRDNPLKSPFTGKPLTGEVEQPAAGPKLMAPQPGTILNGRQFHGGDPRDRNNWVPVTPADRT